MKLRPAIAITLTLAAAVPAHAGLVGTEVSLRTLAQASVNSTPVINSFERRAIVSDLLVEYPNVASLFNPGSTPPPGFAESLVNVAIDVTDLAITIDFANADPTRRFATGYQNTYIFRFDSASAVGITGAKIDTAVTNLGLEPGDVTFAGNELFINVESLRYDRNTFAKIDLLVEGNLPPVPEPSTYAMLGLGLAALAGLHRRKKLRTDPA
jgi:hypothetical protein